MAKKLQRDRVLECWHTVFLVTMTLLDRPRGLGRFLVVQSFGNSGRADFRVDWRICHFATAKRLLANTKFLIYKDLTAQFARQPTATGNLPTGVKKCLEPEETIPYCADSVIRTEVAPLVEPACENRS